MTTDTANVLLGEGWRDGLEAGVRGRIRGFIEELLDEELTAALGRARPIVCRARQANRRLTDRTRRMWCCRSAGIATAIAIGR